MKKLFLFALLIAVSFFTACEKDDDVNPEKEAGTFAIKFDNLLDGKKITLKEPGSTDYQVTDTNGQELNLSLLGYYISEIKLEGPNGESFADPMNVSAKADEVKGYYQVLESESSSRVISLTNVPAGTYDKVTFTIGINESGVQEGAAGGVLDPAEGAWFWNWNAGYIGFAIEGNASNSAQEFVDWGGGFTTAEGSFALHIGGWKEVEPQDGSEKRFVNNVKTLTLPFDAAIKVEEGLSPNAHIEVEVLEVLKGIDFSTNYSVHSPIGGQPFANQLQNAFKLDHVHQ